MSAQPDRMLFSNTPVPRKTLGQLSEEWLDLLSEIVEAEGEMTPELDQRFALLASLLGNKVDAIGHVLKSLELQAVGCRERAAVHTDAARAREKARDRLKDYLAVIMLKMGTRKLVGAEFTGYLRGTDVVAIVDEAKLPEECWKIKRDIDKQGIADALKAGKTIPGARMERREGAYVR